MKITLNTYSFHKWMLKNNQLGIIKLAHDMGFDTISVSNIFPHDNSSPEDYALKLRNECEKYNIKISDFLFGADLINGCDGDTGAEINRVKSMIDIAEILGVSLIRHDISNGANCKSFDSILPVITKACREITEYAESKGIVTTVENHGLFCQGSERVEKLYNSVNHNNFGLLCDIGNFLCADEDPVTAVSRIAPYTKHVHIKDFYFKSGNEPDPGEGFFMTRGCNYLKGAITGQGIVPIVQCLKILKNAGYNGYISIEYEGCEDNIDGVRICYENLKRFLSIVQDN